MASVRQVVAAGLVMASSAAWAQGTVAPGSSLGTQAATAQALAQLRANLETQSIVVSRMAQATTAAQLQQLLTEDSQLVSADLSLLNGLGGVSGGAGVSPPSTSYPGALGARHGGLGATAPAPPGTPSGPASGNPFPFP